MTDVTRLVAALDKCDIASAGDSNDDEIDALRDALSIAVGLLLELGVEIPRGE